MKKSKLVTFLIKQLFQHKFLLFFLFVSLAFLSMTQALLVVLVGPFMKIIVQQDGGKINIQELLPDYLGSILQLEKIQISNNFNIGYLVAIVLLVVILVRSLSSYFYQISQAKLAILTVQALRDNIFSKILQAPFLQSSKISAAKYMSIIMNDTVYLQDRLADILAAFVRDSAMCLAALVALFSIDFKSASLFVLIALPTSYILGYISKRISYFAQKWQQEVSRFSTLVLGFRERFVFIRAQKAEARELEFFAERNDYYYKTIRRSLLIRAAFAPVLEWVGFVVFALFLWFSIDSLASMKTGTTQATMLLSFFVALGLILRPLKNLGEQTTRLRELEGILSDVNDLFASSGEKSNLQSPQTAIEESLIPLHISKLEFGFDKSKSLIMSDFKIIEKEKIALIGPSGSFKTTLMRILSGVYSSAIWQANRQQVDLLAHTQVVLQKPIFFSGSLIDNVTYGLSHKKISRSRVIEILRKLGLVEELNLTLESLESTMSGLQQTISGGQLQRLNIARALLSDSQLLVLDEMTSALDPHSVKLVWQQLNEFIDKNKSALIATLHKLDELDYFDRVVFLENGKLVFDLSLQDTKKHPRFIKFMEQR